jgi:ribonuclease M5
MSSRQIIVVEGKHDEQKIKSIFPNVECIVTNGSEISKETLSLITSLSKENEVILFLDPDSPGKKITEKILETKGSYKLAYINKKQAISKNKTKVGVEHASVEDIKNALSSIKDIVYEDNSITVEQLLKRKLINFPNSAAMRKHICEELYIPYANGKTFLKYLNLLGISIERIDDLIHEQRS